MFFSFNWGNCVLSCSPDYYNNVQHVFYMFSKYFELIFYLILVIVDYN